MQCGTHVWHTCCFISVYSLCALDKICMHTDTVYSFYVAMFGLLVFACASALLKETQVGGVTGNIMFPQSSNLDLGRALVLRWLLLKDPATAP